MSKLVQKFKLLQTDTHPKHKTIQEEKCLGSDGNLKPKINYEFLFCERSPKEVHAAKNSIKTVFTDENNICLYSYLTFF